MLKEQSRWRWRGSWRVVCILCFFGGLYIVRFMMMMVCTYGIYGNGEKKNCDFSLTWMDWYWV